MAARVTKIALHRTPTHSTARANPEQKFWHSFQSPLLINDYSSITSINFSPASPHDFAVTSSTRVQIFSSKTRKPVKTISRFKDVAYSGYIRHDGRVLVAGDEMGLIQVFDLNSRAILRSWGGVGGASEDKSRSKNVGHHQAVHVTKFSPVSNTVVLSASDDTTVRLWDLPTGEVTNTFVGHEDYVRNAAFLVGGGGSAGGMVVSGGYDGCVKLWDPRVGDGGGRDAAVMTLTHPSIIDALLPMPGGTTVLAAAGPIVHVWDIIAAKPLTQLENHQKTITTLAFTTVSSSSSSKDFSASLNSSKASISSKGRVISGSLDGHVKIYDTTSWSIVHGIKYPSPILSLAISPGDQKHLVVGMDSGLLSIRTRTSRSEKLAEKEKEKVYQAIMEGKPLLPSEQEKRKKRKYMGMKYKGDSVEDSATITHFIDPLSKKGGKVKLANWEKMIRQGKYDDALDIVLSSTSSSSAHHHSATMQKQGRQRQSPIVVYTVLLHLKHLTALHAALANRDPQSLAPVLRWLIKHIKRPHFMELIVDVSLIVLDLYAGVLGQSRVIDRLISRLRETVAREVESCQMANRIIGMVGMLVGGGGGGSVARATFKRSAIAGARDKDIGADAQLIC